MPPTTQLLAVGDVFAESHLIGYHLLIGKSQVGPRWKGPFEVFDFSRQAVGERTHTQPIIVRRPNLIDPYFILFSSPNASCENIVCLQRLAAVAAIVMLTAMKTQTLTCIKLVVCFVSRETE